MFNFKYSIGSRQTGKTTKMREELAESIRKNYIDVAATPLIVNDDEDVSIDEFITDVVYAVGDRNQIGSIVDEAIKAIGELVLRVSKPNQTMTGGFGHDYTNIKIVNSGDFHQVYFPMIPTKAGDKHSLRITLIDARNHMKMAENKLPETLKLILEDVQKKKLYSDVPIDCDPSSVLNIFLDDIPHDTSSLLSPLDVSMNTARVSKLLEEMSVKRPEQSINLHVNFISYEQN